MKIYQINSETKVEQFDRTPGWGVFDNSVV